MGSRGGAFLTFLKTRVDSGSGLDISLAASPTPPWAGGADRFSRVPRVKKLPGKADERAIGVGRERVAGLIRLCLFDETLLFDN